jgi:hypothetical protein
MRGLCRFTKFGQLSNAGFGAEIYPYKRGAAQRPDSGFIVILVAEANVLIDETKYT